MGSIVTHTTSPLIDVTVSDPDAEAVSVINIWYGIPGSGTAPTVLTSAAGVSSLSYTHIFATGTYYYYAEIIQADGNITWTSPVWYTKTTNPLPVELVQFSGKHVTAGNLLTWSTASELNNDYFILERSTNGVEFVGIARIEGMGTVSTTTDYSFLDTEAQPGISYYRLKQTDFDGTTITTPVIAVEWKLAHDAFQVYPNPAIDMITIALPDDMVPNSLLRITDATGRIVLERSNLKNGQVIDCSELARGNYSVTIYTPHGVFPVRLTLQ
jgi:hypothetical protein